MTTASAPTELTMAQRLKLYAAAMRTGSEVTITFSEADDLRELAKLFERLDLLRDTVRSFKFTDAARDEIIRSQDQVIRTLQTWNFALFAIAIAAVVLP